MTASKPTLRCATCGAPLKRLSTACPTCGESPLLDGRYVLGAIIGQGAAGVTYRGRRVSDGKYVCVKELRWARAHSTDDVEQFHREARVLQQLSHPGIPAYVDEFSAGRGREQALYLVQELVDGENLAKEMARRRVSEGDVLAMLEQLLDTLVYLHGLSPAVVHRDLKPGNVIRRRSDRRLLLVDFGSVREAGASLAAGQGSVAGTFGYMAPEQMFGIATPRSDLYSLGVLAVVLLSRREPHMLAQGHRLAWEAHVNVSPGTAELLAALLKPDPEQRLGTATEALAWVRRLREGKRSDLQRTATGRTPLATARREAPAEDSRLSEADNAGTVAAIIPGMLASWAVGGLLFLVLMPRIDVQEGSLWGLVPLGGGVLAGLVTYLSVHRAERKRVLKSGWIPPSDD
ncbi:serine/threonine protein kinase [Pyxidicoccus fallax]|uniref:non-specific serine/threonine protein kinase n=1 Tax=Pyxidicoccus fallax TaxID=394095 RepID=A0A848LHS8_9BACT|nr:serine/threonine-protein kinase [Pyxidicoccus fallax]NMO17161.1 serine/threonine protein kinase [Pyxidicoccus fallax]NPC85069.1 serine/threonine protein kinase [Pyxidicoccus fallax]